METKIFKVHLCIKDNQEYSQPNHLIPLLAKLDTLTASQIYLDIKIDNSIEELMKFQIFRFSLLLHPLKLLMKMKNYSNSTSKIEISVHIVLTEARTQFLSPSNLNINLLCNNLILHLLLLPLIKYKVANKKLEEQLILDFPNVQQIQWILHQIPCLLVVYKIIKIKVHCITKVQLKYLLLLVLDQQPNH